MSFPPGTPSPYSRRKHRVADTDTDTDTTGNAAEASPGSGPNEVLANATETSLTGCALGPDLFVRAVVDAYTHFLEREIINGPVGERLRENARVRQEGKRARMPPLGKVLIAGALPPLVEDEILPRIPEKYVERLEDEHEKAQRALRMGQARGMGVGMMRGASNPDTVEAGVSTMRITDNPLTPARPKRGDADSPPQSARSIETASASASASTAPSSPPSTASAWGSKPPSPTCAPPPRPAPAAPRDKTPIIDLLMHDPPLCTLATRIAMTDAYNAALRAFVLRFPTELAWVDITTSMLDADERAVDAMPSSEATSARLRAHSRRVVDRGTWACPVDPTNVHPLWEPTLPLWLEGMGELGLPVGGWRMDEAAEETFRAYEADKRRRTEQRDREWAAESESRAIRERMGGKGVKGGGDGDGWKEGTGEEGERVGDGRGVLRGRARVGEDGWPIDEPSVSGTTDAATAGSGEATTRHHEQDGDVDVDAPPRSEAGAIGAKAQRPVDRPAKIGADGWTIDDSASSSGSFTGVELVADPIPPTSGPETSTINFTDPDISLGVGVSGGGAQTLSKHAADTSPHDDTGSRSTSEQRAWPSYGPSSGSRAGPRIDNSQGTSSDAPRWVPRPGEGAKGERRDGRGNNESGKTLARPRGQGHGRAQQQQTGGYVQYEYRLPRGPVVGGSG